MEFPTPSSAVVAIAAFVRDRLADVGGTLAPLWTRFDGVEIVPAGQHPPARNAARQVAMVIVGAAAPFAVTSQARVRLLRQAHASGLLTARETEYAIAADAAAFDETHTGADRQPRGLLGASG